MRSGRVVKVSCGGANGEIEFDGGGTYRFHFSEVEPARPEQAPLNWTSSISCGFALREGDRVVYDNSSTRPIRLVV